jgi:hypothetical protein
MSESLPAFLVGDFNEKNKIIIKNFSNMIYTKRCSSVAPQSNHRNALSQEREFCR